MQKDNVKIKNDDGQQKKIDELNGKYLRALADYQNLQKQTESWRQEFVQYASSNLVGKLLEILDDLEAAQEHLQDGGLKLIIGKLQNVLRDEGLEELIVEGKPFDPTTAEVISTEPGDQDQVVARVLQKGYRLKDKVVRPAKVIVSTNN